MRELLGTYVENHTASLEENQTGNFQVAPVPFTNELSISYENVSSDHEIQFTLTDAVGQTIATRITDPLIKKHAVIKFQNLESLLAGIYFVQITANGGKVQTIKVVK
ncbi:hypothetical protein D3C80_1381650 [compost metagenome]